MLGRRGALRLLALPPCDLARGAPVRGTAHPGHRHQPAPRGRLPSSFDYRWNPTLVQYVSASWPRDRICAPSWPSPCSWPSVSPASVTVLAFPIAYFLAFRARERATLFLPLLLLIPSAVSFLLRVMAWRPMLGGEGAINSFLEWTRTHLRPGRPAPLLPRRRRHHAHLRLDPVRGAPYLRGAPAYRPRAPRGGRRPRGGAVDALLARDGPDEPPGGAGDVLHGLHSLRRRLRDPALVGGTDGFMYGNIIQDFFTRSALAMGSALSVIMLVLTAGPRRPRAADHQPSRG